MPSVCIHTLFSVIVSALKCIQDFDDFCQIVLIFFICLIGLLF